MPRSEVLGFEGQSSNKDKLGKKQPMDECKIMNNSKFTANMEMMFEQEDSNTDTKTKVRKSYSQDFKAKRFLDGLRNQLSNIKFWIIQNSQQIWR